MSEQALILMYRSSHPPPTVLEGAGGVEFDDFGIIVETARVTEREAWEYGGGVCWSLLVCQGKEQQEAKALVTRAGDIFISQALETVHGGKAAKL